MYTKRLDTALMIYLQPWPPAGGEPSLRSQGSIAEYPLAHHEAPLRGRNMNKFIVTINRLICNSMRPFLVVVLLVMSSPVSHASEDATLDLELLARDGITVYSVNLTAKHFFKSYMSDLADERRSAHLYLLGVLDATEGKSWSDYRTFKAITLRETIFSGFKKLDQRQLNERASKVIEAILSQRYSYLCGRKK